MHRDGICRDSNGKPLQKFCCPFKRKKNATCPINHKAFKNTSKSTGCTRYTYISNDYRLSIARDSIAFKSIYSLRTEAERYNSRFKSTDCERVFVRNINSVKNLNTIAHISLLAIAIATVSLKKPVSYRSTKAVKRIA